MRRMQSNVVGTGLLATLAVSLAASTLLPESASAQTTLRAGFGGPRGFGSSCLGENDDGSSPAIDITQYFPGGLNFYSTTPHTQFYLNTNGNITFSGPLGTYTPNAFPVASRPMIAPFWADVDHRRSGDSCRTVLPATCSHPDQDNNIWWHLAPNLAVFTWERVGYYRCHAERRMSFQLILSAATDACGGAAGGANNFDVEFRFAECGWETGDASQGTNGFGGTQAQSGFDAGDNVNFVMLEGSRQAGIANRLCTMSNVDEPGVWRFSVQGGAVVCPGGGEVCNVDGQVGACAIGRTNCSGAGVSCQQQVQPSDERCDAIDNDCNGAVDDGEGLCDLGSRCVRGVCINPCFEGGCNPGEVCTDGVCVDEACASVECGANERCRGGACIGACTDITCPLGQECRAGRCVDPCSGVTCDDCTACVEGACVARCTESSCASGQVCGNDGRCVASGCESMTCPLGEFCQGGSCVDACTGAICPEGELCQGGACVRGMSTQPDAGFTDFGDAGGNPTGLVDAATGGPDEEDAGEDFEDVDGGPRRRSESGCGCRVGQRDGSSALAGLGLALVGLLARRRRRS